MIKQMARDNVLWGSQRIRGELLKLNIYAAKRTIQKYIRQARGSRPSTHNWHTFVRNHAYDQYWKSAKFGEHGGKFSVCMYCKDKISYPVSRKQVSKVGSSFWTQPFRLLHTISLFGSRKRFVHGERS